jgi:hypothetical protein
MAKPMMISTRTMTMTAVPTLDLERRRKDESIEVSREAEREAPL